MKLKKFRHQAAGHDGPLTNSDEMLLFKPTCHQEIEFYESVVTRPVEEEYDDVPLRLWMPSFLGTLNAEKSETWNGTSSRRNKMLSTEVDTDNGPYLVLENLVFGYLRPNVLDIKLGKILWDKHASPEKIQRLKEVSNSTTSGSLGFRICGMHIERNKNVTNLLPSLYEETENDYIFINKFYGRQLSAEATLDAFKLFFGSNTLNSHDKAVLVDAFLNRLRLLYNTLLNEEVRMISSSLLFVYEGDTSRWKNVSCNHELVRPSIFTVKVDDDEEDSDDDEATPELSTLSSLSLIDFAHSRLAPGEGYDENVVIGIENLIDIFERLTFNI